MTHLRYRTFVIIVCLFIIFVCTTLVSNVWRQIDSVHTYTIICVILCAHKFAVWFVLMTDNVILLKMCLNDIESSFSAVSKDKLHRYLHFIQRRTYLNRFMVFWFRQIPRFNRNLWKTNIVQMFHKKFPKAPNSIIVNFFHFLLNYPFNKNIQ